MDGESSLHDLAFNTKSNLFIWLQVCMQKVGDDEFKSCNVGTSVAETIAVYMWDNFCVSNELQARKVINYTFDPNGSYISFDL